MVKIREGMKPIVNAVMMVLIAASSLQLMWVLGFLWFSGVGNDLDVMGVLASLAGTGLVTASKSWMVWQAIVELLVAALVCSCRPGWGSWAFTRGDCDEWSHPLDVRFAGTLLNVFVCVGVLHIVGAASYFLMSHSHGIVRFVVVAVVLALYVFFNIGSQTWGMAFMLRLAQCLTLFITIMALNESGNPAVSLGMAFAAGTVCYLLEAVEPFLTERYCAMVHRMLDWLGISIKEG